MARKDVTDGYISQDMTDANDNFIEIYDALDTKVALTGNETIAGVKTFSSSPVVPTPTTDYQASTKKYADDGLDLKVATTGNETVAGIKTFSSFPLTPSSAPSTNYQAANKKYVDDEIAAAVIPSGTSMLFNQAAAPTGWTKKSDWANNASIIVGNTYGTGGSDSATEYTTAVAVADHATHVHTGPSHVHAMPSHAHSVVVPRSGWSWGGDQYPDYNGYLVATVTGIPNATVDANRTLTSSSVDPGNTLANGTQDTGAASLSAHSITQSTHSPRYVCVIAAAKD